MVARALGTVLFLCAVSHGQVHVDVWVTAYGFPSAIAGSSLSADVLVYAEQSAGYDYASKSFTLSQVEYSPIVYLPSVSWFPSYTIVCGAYDGRHVGTDGRTYRIWWDADRSERQSGFSQTLHISPNWELVD